MNIKQVLLFLFFIVGMTLMLGACSDKDFSAAPGSVYTQCVDVRPEVRCIETCNDSGHCTKDFDYTIGSSAQEKDILFINDVSGSMYFEQQRMGSMFPNLLNNLRDVNYRVAITTTDISSADNPAHPKNGNGAFQDGRLVPFTSGRYFLDGTLSNEQSLFEQAIAWEQTDLCERNGYDYDSRGNVVPPSQQQCPSGDERGLIASYMTFRNNYENFIRPVGHMAVVILSDEDNDGDTSKGEFRHLDTNIENPNNYIERFRELYPNKSLSFHSIVIQPGDTQCFNQQLQPGHPPGRYGQTYAELSSLTDGIRGDICANNSNYASQLNAIANSISQARDILPCRPINDQVDIQYIPEPSQQVEVIKNFSQNEIIFQNLPANTQIRLKYTCQSNN